MVFFCCDKCGESLKKNQVQTHQYRCRSQSYSCLDCSEIFSPVTYAQHLKCISENQKYGGKNYVEKENKGEVKQNAWTEQVERAIEAVKDRDLKGLLNRIQGFSNIPRKEAKFINFLANSLRIHDKNLCTRAWNAIAEEAKKIQAETKAAAEAEKKEKEEAEKASKEEKEEETKDGEEKEKSKEETEVNDNSSVASFKWKKVLKRKLKEAGGEMKIKKLRVIIQSEYTSTVGEVGDFKELFNEKLNECGFSVEGKTVALSA